MGFYENVNRSSWQDVTDLKENAWQPFFHSFCQSLRPMTVNFAFMSSKIADSQSLPLASSDLQSIRTQQSSSRLAYSNSSWQ